MFMNILYIMKDNNFYIKHIIMKFLRWLWFSEVLVLLKQPLYLPLLRSLISFYAVFIIMNRRWYAVYIYPVHFNPTVVNSQWLAPGDVVTQSNDHVVCMSHCGVAQIDQLNETVCFSSSPRSLQMRFVGITWWIP